MVFALLVGLAAVGPAQANQILNGSFETPVVPPATFQNIPVGSEPAGFDWTVVTNSVDLVSNVLAYEGDQLLDLVGFGSTGAIQQTFATVAGQQYTFFFAYANNPISTTTASADVTITDGVTTLLSQSITHNTSTISDLDWATLNLSFIATGTSATLLYNNTVGSNNGGILLDAVDITAVPLPGAVWLLGSGLLSLAGFKGRFWQKS